MTANPLSPLTPVGGASHPPHHAVPAAPRLTPLDPIRVLRQYLLLLVLTVVTGLVLGTVIWFLLDRYAAEYSSMAKLVATGGVSSAMSDPTEPGTSHTSHPDVLASLIQNQIAIIKSDEVINEALKNVGVQQTRWFLAATVPPGQEPTPARMEAARNRLQEDLSASAAPRSTLIDVTLRGRYPDDLQRVLSAVIDAYLQANRIRSQSSSAGVQEVFSTQKRQSEADIRQIEEQLRLSQVDMPMLEARNNQTAQAYESLTQELLKRNLEAQAAQERLKGLEAAMKLGPLAPTPEDIAVVESDPSVVSRDEKLRQLHERRLVLLATFGESHRSVQELDQEVVATRQERQREMDRLLRQRQEVKLDFARKVAASTEAGLADVRANLADAKTKVDTLTAQMSEAARLTSLLNDAKKRQESAAAKLRDLEILGQRPDELPVHAYIAPRPPSQVFPRASLTILGTTVLLTVLVGGLVFAKELLDQRIKTAADVKLLPQTELLGALPEAGDDPLGSGQIEGVVGRDPSSLMAESFRQVRSAVLTGMDRNGYKTLMLVAAHPGAGVSCVVQNLAVSLASVGRRVLVIEANLRRPRVHRLFGGQVEPGLIDVLRGHLKLDDAIIHFTAGGVDALSLGDASEATPEVFESQSFGSLLHRCAARYDIVLIDAPPALLASESLLLARNVDAVAVVVRAMQEKRGAIGRMLRQFRSQRADVLGVIVNGLRSSAGGYFRKNYEEFYRYRGPGVRRAASVDQPGPMRVEHEDEEDAPQIDPSQA